MGRNWQPKYKCICTKCDNKLIRVAVSRPCPKCGGKVIKDPTPTTEE